MQAIALRASVFQDGADFSIVLYRGDGDDLRSLEVSVFDGELTARLQLGRGEGIATLEERDGAERSMILLRDFIAEPAP